MRFSTRDLGLSDARTRTGQTLRSHVPRPTKPTATYRGGRTHVASMLVPATTRYTEATAIARWKARATVGSSSDTPRGTSVSFDCRAAFASRLNRSAVKPLTHRSPWRRVENQLCCTARSATGELNQGVLCPMSRLHNLNLNYTVHAYAYAYVPSWVARSGWVV